jgi:hydroxypyruvate reductase
MGNIPLSIARQLLQDVYHAGLSAVHGTGCVTDYLGRSPLKSKVAIVAIGKAASAMAIGALQVLGGQMCRGLIITKEGHVDSEIRHDGRLTCIEAGHPVPNKSSLAAGDALCRFIDATPDDEELLFLISGGTSSLVEVLPEGVTLDMLARVNRWLLSSGLNIMEMNQVRQSLSLIKGGRLISRLGERQVTNLMISDVPGNDPAVIGSGLLKAPQAVVEFSPRLPGWLQQLPANAPPISSATGRVEQQVIADNAVALQAMADRGKALGMPVIIRDEMLAGEAARAGHEIVSRIKQLPAGMYLWGGETTVTLPDSPGSGGRNQHLALAAASDLKGNKEITLLAAGTDGTDGSTQAAGAIVDSGTLDRGSVCGQTAESCLEQADAGTYLEASGDLINTGPTGTNVMDVVIGLKMNTAQQADLENVEMNVFDDMSEKSP